MQLFSDSPYDQFDDVVPPPCDNFRLRKPENNSSISHIKLFPNPVTEVLIVQNITNGESVYIFDAYGNLLFKERVIEGTANLDVSNLPTGIYFVRNGISSTKFIKVN